MIAVTDPVEIHDENLELLRAVLPSTYTNIRFFKDGGTRRCYLADWGPGGQKRVIKVDKKPEGPRAERHVERGCTTANDLVALSRIPDPGAHHLSALVDFCEIGLDGNKRLAVAEPYFDGATLEDIVSARPLNREEFERVFVNVLDGSSYLTGVAGMYHRDLKPSNILVNRETGDVRITDLANARKKEEVKLDYQPTVGGHLVTDPRLLGPFTGNETVYDETAEVYALGMNMYFALTGEYPFEYDPDKGVATDLKTGESLLNKEGKIDVKKHNKVLARALKKIPRGSRKYRELIRRCLTLDNNSGWDVGKRYKTLDTLVEEFRHEVRDDYLNTDRFSGAVGKAVIPLVAGFGIVFLGALGNGVYEAFTGRNFYDGKDKAALVAQENEKSTYIVKSQWDAGALELRNSIVDATVDLRYPVIGSSSNRVTKKNLSPGDQLGVMIKFRNTPGSLPDGEIFTGYAGKLYLEGFEAEDFYLYPGSFDTAKVSEGYNVGGTYQTIDIPKDIGDGIHTLVLEFYAPNSDIDKSNARIVFAQPGRAIIRKRVPLVIGQLNDPVDLATLTFGDWKTMAIYPFENGRIVAYGSMDRDMSCELSVPEEGFTHTYDYSGNPSNAFTAIPELPRGTSTDDRTFQLVYRRDGRTIGYTFLPIGRVGRVDRSGNGNLEWQLVAPGSNFSDRLVEYRKAIELKDKPR